MSATQGRAVAPIDKIRAEFNSPVLQAQLQAALPRHVEREKFTRVALTTIAQNPDLLRCQQASLFRSFMTCAQLGLMPDAVLGEAYVVAYKPRNQEQPIAQLQIGYKGLLKLARQSGQISTVETGLIHERDTFEWEMGTDSKFRIIPRLGDRGDPIAVYAILRYKDGGLEYEVMTVEDVEAIRKRAPGRDSPAWTNSWGEMARKTVLRRLLKKAPLSTEQAAAIAVDEAREERGEMLQLTDAGIERVETPEQMHVASGKAVPTKRGREKLEALAQQAEEIVMEGDGGAEEPPIDE